jgi:tellurite resistance protein
VPPNFFGIALGLVGLAEAWGAAVPILGTPLVIPDVADILAATVWMGLVVAYSAQGARVILADLRDPVLAPFVPLPAIAGMLLGSALGTYALGAAKVLVTVFLAITILVGGLLMGQWILGNVEEARIHPGYFLPTVAGGLVGAFCEAQVDFRAVAEASFGIGIISWFFLGSLLFSRLFFRPALATALAPTLAIELAPPAVAGVALFALNGSRASPFACALGGYAVLMALMQVRFLSVYAKLPFSPGFWIFTFSYAVAATDALEWISVKRPVGSLPFAACVLAAITLLIGVIGVRTVVLLFRGRLFPPTPTSNWSS